MHCLVFTDTDLYSLTKGKAYLANQRWRRSMCLRDQCYDVGCHPCKLLTERHLEFLSLTVGYTCSCECTQVNMQHCWKSHVTAQIPFS